MNVTRQSLVQVEQLAVLGIDEQDARRALRATGAPPIHGVPPIQIGVRDQSELRTCKWKLHIS